MTLSIRNRNVNVETAVIDDYGNSSVKRREKLTAASGIHGLAAWKSGISSAGKISVAG